MVIAILSILGLAFGSFINAFVWRVHEQDKKKSKFKKAELSIIKGRSMCTDCGHVLGCKDLIPVVSFIILKGKCRYCKKPVSLHYVLVELLTALLFATSYIFWPHQLGAAAQIGVYAAFLGFLTIAIALSLSDIKWMILPTRLVYWLGFFAVLFVALSSVDQASFMPIISGLLGGIGFGGFFYILYQLSKGKWIGGGDVRLGFVLGLILGWQGSIIGLTAATYLALAVVLVLLFMAKYHKKMRVPFGPFLLLGAYFALLWGQAIIDWYLKVSGLAV